MGEERRNWELVFNGYGIPILQDEKSSGDDGGYGCKTMWMHLMQLKWTLKMIKWKLYTYIASIKIKCMCAYTHIFIYTHIFDVGDWT